MWCGFISSFASWHWFEIPYQLLIELSNNSGISVLIAAGSGDVAARAWNFVKKKATGTRKSSCKTVVPWRSTKMSPYSDVRRIWKVSILSFYLHCCTEKTNYARVLITHIPLFRPDDTPCGIDRASPVINQVSTYEFAAVVPDLTTQHLVFRVYILRSQDNVRWYISCIQSFFMLYWYCFETPSSWLQRVNSQPYQPYQIT